MSLAYLLLWPAHLRSTYEYGCQVSVSPEHVVSYRAPLMPPGEVIHDWRSQRNAGQEHLSCELPILTPGRAYTLDGNITVIAGGVYLRLRFFDATNAELDPIILDGTSGRFTFPSTAVNYRIELVNTHHQQVMFRYLLLAEQTTATTHTFTVDQVLGTVQITTKAAQTSHVDLVVRQNATKLLWIAPNANNLVGFVTPQQLRDPNWVHQLNQKRDAFLAAQPHTSPQASGLDAWQALERHWQPQSVQNQEDQL